jgi:phosphoacetylglucosamine mutase
VKYLHHAAKAFDIGIYFESNGHGTVLFKPSLLQQLQDQEMVQVGGAGMAGLAAGIRLCGAAAAQHNTPAPRSRSVCCAAAAAAAAAACVCPTPQLTIVQLLAVSRLMNQAVGDAISGLLLCDVVLRTGHSLQEWVQLYTDLPSRQLKLVVADRTAITTTDAERKCVTPAGAAHAHARAGWVQ